MADYETTDTNRRPAGYAGKDGLKELGKVLGARNRAGKTDRNDREKSWDQGRAFYYSEPDPSASDDPYDGSANSFLNVLQYVIDGLKTHVVGTIISQKPYCHATMPVTDSEQAEELRKVQRSVWFFAERGKIEKGLQTVSLPAGWSNAGHLRIEWDEKKLKPKFCDYEPDEVVVYPAVIKNLEDATWYAYRIWRRKSVIDDKQAKGEYFKGVVSTVKDPGVEKENTYRSIHAEIKHTVAASGKDELCELYRGCFTDEAGDRWWATIADDLVLKLDPVPSTYLDVDCFRFGYKNESGTGYWDKGSVAQDVKGGQIDINKLYNMLLDGIAMNSQGVVLMDAYPGASTLEKFKPGDVIERPGAQNAQVWTPKVDLAYIPGTIWQMVQHQEKVSRMSAAGSGGEFKSGTTAAAAGLAGQGQQAGVNEYISVFGEPLAGEEGIFAYIQALLYTHWADWFPKYGQFLGLKEEDVELFALPIEWKLSASSASATPQAQIQAIQTLVPLSGQMPGLGIDQYQIGGALIKNLQDMGVLGAGDFQLPESPDQILLQVAMKTGIPMEILMPLIQHAQAQLQQSQQQPQPPQQPPQPQGF